MGLVAGYGGINPQSAADRSGICATERKIMTATKSDKWTETESAHHRATARQCFHHSYNHGSKSDPDNCSGCALRDTSDETGPNYAGWARIYVEAGYPIPSIWREAFDLELASENKLYKAALLKSLLTFGHPNWINNETL